MIGLMLMTGYQKAKREGGLMKLLHWVIQEISSNYPAWDHIGKGRRHS